MKKQKLSILFLIISLVLLDQLIKFILFDSFALYQSMTIIKNFFYLTLTYNIGAAFSILSGNRLLLIIISILVLLLIYRYINSIKCIDHPILYSFLTAGIIGNLLDRLFRGYVIDYFHFIIFGKNMPIFNLADVFITLSILILIMFEFKGELCKK